MNEFYYRYLRNYMVKTSMNNRFYFYHKKGATYIYDSYFQRVFNKQYIDQTIGFEKFLEVKEPLLPLPVKDSSIRINPGNACNLRCKYCFAAKEKINIEQEKKIILDSLDWMVHNNTDSSGYWIMYSLTGETFLNIEALQMFMEKIKEYRKFYPDKWFGYFFQTNGTILNDSIVKLLHEHDIKDLTISLDGNKKINDRFRRFIDGSGTFGRIYANIKKLESENISVSVSSVITRKFPHPYKLVKMFSSMTNISKICMRPVRNGKYEPGIIQYICMYLEYGRLYDLIKKQVINGRYDLFNKLKNDYMFETLKYLVQQQKVISRCSFGYQCSIDNNGDIYPCDYTIGIKKFSLGSIYNDNKNVQSRLEPSVRDNDKCAKCKFKYLCGGTCYYQSFVKFNDIYHLDKTECRFRKFLIKKAINFYCNLLSEGFTEEQLKELVTIDLNDEKIDIRKLYQNVHMIHSSEEMIVIEHKKEIIIFSNYTKQIFLLDDRDCLKLFSEKIVKSNKRIEKISVKKIYNLSNILERILTGKQELIYKSSIIVDIVDDKYDEDKINAAIKSSKEKGSYLTFRIYDKKTLNLRILKKHISKVSLLGKKRSINCSDIKIECVLNYQKDNTDFIKYLPPAVENCMLVFEIYDYELLKKMNTINKMSRDFLIKGYKTQIKIIFTDGKYLLPILNKLRKLSASRIVLDPFGIIKMNQVSRFYRKLYSILAKSIIYEDDFFLFIKLKEDLSIRLFMNLISKVSVISCEGINEKCRKCEISSFCTQENNRCSYLKLISRLCLDFETILLKNGIKPKSFESVKING